MTTVANAADRTFLIHHFLNPQSPSQRVLLAPWAKAVDEVSGSRIKFENFPAMALGSKPRKHSNPVADGVADPVGSLQGYAQGVFPCTEVFKLPNTHNGCDRANYSDAFDGIEAGCIKEASKSGLDAPAFLKAEASRTLKRLLPVGLIFGSIILGLGVGILTSMPAAGVGVFFILAWGASLWMNSHEGLTIQNVKDALLFCQVFSNFRISL